MLEALAIISGSWPIAFMVVALFVGFGIAYSTYRATRTDPLVHQETMAKLETTHREIMLKINRDMPKLVDASEERRRSGGG